MGQVGKKYQISCMDVGRILGQGRARGDSGYEFVETEGDGVVFISSSSPRGKWMG